jgi:hypothetical protein
LLLILLNHFLELIQDQLGGKNARKKRERQRQLDDIKDPDLKRELASGQTQLISYTDITPSECMKSNTTTYISTNTLRFS